MIKRRGKFDALEYLQSSGTSLIQQFTLELIGFFRNRGFAFKGLLTMDIGLIPVLE